VQRVVDGLDRVRRLVPQSAATATRSDSQPGPQSPPIASTPNYVRRASRQPHCWPTMRVNMAAAVGAAIGALLAAVGDAEHPAQVVVTLAASSAFLALLTRRGQVRQSDWFTVRVLLAGNLVVFWISYAHALAASAALLGLALLVVAIWARILERKT
jgi:hypothetical protein